MLAACCSFDDYRTMARSKLPHFLFEYFDASAIAGTTSRRNRDDLDAIEVVHPVLRDHTDERGALAIDTRTTLFGASLAIPAVLGPIGLAGLASPRGERAAMRAAAAAGTQLCLSTASICPVNEVARDGQAPWYQLYLPRDRDLAAHMLATVLGAGCRTLVLTVDTPVLGIRWPDTRSGLNDMTARGRMRRAAQIGTRPGWAARIACAGRPVTLGNISALIGGKATLARTMAFSAQALETDFGPPTLRWVRENWPHQLLVKGLTEPEDARIAMESGYDGIVVSNHGGRQLDGARSSIRALVAIGEAVRGRVPLLLDSGVRSGIDVIKAIAAGASAVMIGRAWVFALSAAGEAGVARLLAGFANELRMAMTLCGARTIAQLSHPGTIRLPRDWRSPDAAVAPVPRLPTDFHNPVAGWMTGVSNR